MLLKRNGMSDRYPIPAGPARTEIMAANSRFIASAGHTPSVEEARAFITALVVYGQALLQCRRHQAILTDVERRSGYLRLHLIGAALLPGGGWLGGYLVYQLGLGVRAG
jgi:hypothetical protein